MLKVKAKFHIRFINNQETIATKFTSRFVFLLALEYFIYKRLNQKQGCSLVNIMQRFLMLEGLIARTRRALAGY